jgi:hypothetical protein
MNDKRGTEVLYTTIMGSDVNEPWLYAGDYTAVVGVGGLGRHGPAF